MNTDFPPERQWTLRIFPWLAIIICVVLIVPMVWIMVKDGFSCGIFVTFLVVIAVLLALSEVVTCEFDLDRRMVTLQRRHLWSNKQHEFSFDDVHTVSVQRSDSSSDGGSTYSVLFVLKSGERIPLTNYSSSGKRSKEKLAQKITAYINQGRISPVNEALDGVVRIAKEGVTDGVNWQMLFVTNNDHVPLTRWQTTDTRFTEGFLLIVPASGAQTMSMPGGMLGSVVRFFYSQYLRMLDLNEHDLPGFDKAEVLQGSAMGLESRFTVVTNHTFAAKSWLTPQKARQLTAWSKTSPLGKGAASDPHIVVTANGMWLVLRGNYREERQMDEITRLGAAITRD